MKIYYSTKFGNHSDTNGKELGLYLLPMKFKHDGKWHVGVLVYKSMNEKFTDVIKVAEIDRNFILHNHYAVLICYSGPESRLVNTSDECCKILDKRDIGDGRPLKDCAIELNIDLDNEEILRNIIDQLDIDDPNKSENTLLFT